MTCGSSLRLALSINGQGQVDALGLQVQACAIGQASAALFAKHAIGRSIDDIAYALEQLTQWLKQTPALPDWPGLQAIVAARDYPARHGAIMLAWQAALQALSSAVKPG